jgi:plasmid stability protein
MKKDGIQYTIRNVSERVDQCLRETATRDGISLNQAAQRMLSRGLGLENEPVLSHDLDQFAGSWVKDDQVEQALDEMDRIDQDLWE